MLSAAQRGIHQYRSLASASRGVQDHTVIAPLASSGERARIFPPQSPFVLPVASPRLTIQTSPGGLVATTAPEHRVLSPAVSHLGELRILSHFRATQVEPFLE